MTNGSIDNIATALAAGAEMVELEKRMDAIGGVPIVLLTGTQRVEVPKQAIDIAEQLSATPRRRKGTAHHTELESFVDHVKRFAGDHSAIFADVDALTLTAVFNYHPSGAEQGNAAWCDHRAVYECPLSDRWKLWTEMSGKMLRQEQFAQFIEDNLEDLTSSEEGEEYPSPIDVLEMARKLQLHTKGVFSRRVDARTGAYELVCKEETQAVNTSIPRAFMIAIPVFEAGELWRCEARMRCRVDTGFPMLGFEVHRHAEIVREAFTEVRGAAKGKTGLPLFAGTPEA